MQLAQAGMLQLAQRGPLLFARTPQCSIVMLACAECLQSGAAYKVGTTGSLFKGQSLVGTDIRIGPWLRPSDSPWSGMTHQSSLGVRQFPGVPFALDQD